MKLMFASDIHGSAKYCKLMFEAFKQENPERLILLGDLLYHGPRNDLPEEYAPKAVIEMLNEHKDKILCVRGNCEAEVDQMVLEFPVMSDSCIIYEQGRMFFVTHGHQFNLDHLPLIGPEDILIHGHTHVQKMVRTPNCIYLNPGSVSIPKEGNQHSYMIYEDSTFTIKNLSGEMIQEFTLF